MDHFPTMVVYTLEMIDCSSISSSSGGDIRWCYHWYHGHCYNSKGEVEDDELVER